MDNATTPGKSLSPAKLAPLRQDANVPLPKGDRMAGLETQITDLQIALTELYEGALDG